jgi:hypothetical protein
MAISLKHLFQSAKTDGPDNTIVQPSDWNDEHVLTQATNRLLGRTTAGAGATEEIAPGTGITLSAGTLSADVTSVAGRTGAVTLSTADISGLTTGYVQKTSATGSAYLPAGTTGQREGSPAAGYIRYNTTTGKFEGYGSAWGNIGGGAAIGDTPPANPGAGDLWWNSADGRMYVYYTDANSSQWVDLSAGGAGQYLPLTGGDVTGNVTVTGNVGIGTSSPSKKLVVSNSGAAGVELDPFTRSATTGASLLAYNRSTASYARMDYDASEQLFFISGTERARLNSNGDLCIGTTVSGGYRLRVDSTTGAYVTTSGSNSAIYGYASGSGNGIVGYSQTAIAGSFTAANNHGVLSYGLYYGLYGQTTNSGYGGVLGYAQNGSNYGILGYANAWALYGTGSAYISGTYQGSDERLKQNISDLGDSLHKITQLRAVTFDWKPNTDASLDGSYSDVGLIAQEAINILPNIVKETTAPPLIPGKTPTLNQELGTFYTIDYGKLIPYMVDAIQELKAELDTVKSELAQLKGGE